jgi:hypothetical protein
LFLYKHCSISDFDISDVNWWLILADKLLLLLLLLLLLFTELTVEQLERYSDWFRKEEALRVGESKRPGRENKAKNVTRNEDSLTRLEID